MTHILVEEHQFEWKISYLKNTRPEEMVQHFIKKLSIINFISSKNIPSGIKENWRHSYKGKLNEFVTRKSTPEEWLMEIF